MPKLNREMAALGLVTSIALLAACGNSDDGSSASGENEEVEISFTWWGDDSRAEAMNEAIDLYENNNPNVTVKGSFSNFGSYWEKRSVEGAASNLPDVMMFNLPFLRDYAERDLLLDLADGGDALDISQVAESTLRGGKVNGVQYGIPIGTNIMSVISNPGVYDAAGVELPHDDMTWVEFYERLAEVGASDAGAWGGDTLSGTSTALLELQLVQEGTSLFTDDGQLGFDEGRLARFWTALDALGESETLIPANREAEIEPQFAIAAGLVGSRVAYDNTAAQFLNPETAPELVLSIPPVDDGAEASGLFPRPALLLVGGSNTEHSEVVADFISFMINDPEVGHLFGASRGIPVTQSQLDAIQLEGLDKQLAEYEELVAPLLGETPPAPPAGWAALESHFNRISGEIRTGTKTPEEGAAEFFNEADGLLDIP